MKNAWIFFWCIVLLVPLLGCRGCSRNLNTPEVSQDDAEAKKKKQKQRLAADELRTLPFAKEQPLNMVKPGHWYQVRNKIKANFGDESLTAAISIVDRDGIPFSYGWGSDSVYFMRNLSLAVGQEKAIDATILHPFLPQDRLGDDTRTRKTTSIRTRFSNRGIGTPILEENFPCTMLEGYQYDLVVLSRDISRHLFWRGLDCIVWKRSDDIQEYRVVPHRIIDIQEDEITTQFPNRLATMTSVSHVVINDVSLSVMTQEQQEALADWLYFGGTIIINGPEARGSIEASQLKDWSPLANLLEGEWSDDSQSEFDRTWTVRIAGGERINFQNDRKIPILRGDLTENASWVPTLEGLVAERLIGQGRVVITTFPMTDAAFLRWPSYSSLIHNAILRKPHRTPSLGTEASTLYADSFEGTERNPFHSTRLRLWARDLDASTARTDRETERKRPENDIARFPVKKSTSFGAWNPESSVVEKATECLRESSGITVPRVATIVKLLLGYLIVLVPINWLFFRLLGRVELAWVAAPIIAMLGAAYVAGSVRLDVGFSQSQTSFGFLEVHNEHPRGSLSNFYAFYTSLSTNYEAVYKEGNGLVAPVLRGAMRTGVGEGQSLEYWNADDRGTGLQRFSVLSNSTGMLQSEEMVGMSGALRWTLDSENSKIQLKNDTAIPIRDIGVFGINDQGKLVMSWIGSIEPGQSTAQLVQPRSPSSKLVNTVLPEKGVISVSGNRPRTIPEGRRWFPQWEDNPLLKKPTSIRSTDGLLWTDEPVDDVYMGAMLLVVAERYPLQKGEYIALGWTDANPSALQISPKSSQQKHKTVVLMHIRAASLGDVQPDTRIFASLNDEEEAGEN